MKEHIILLLSKYFYTQIFGHRNLDIKCRIDRQNLAAKRGAWVNLILQWEN